MLHSILAVANLLAHNNTSKICYCGQISLQSAAVNSTFSDNLAPWGVPFILLAMVHKLIAKSLALQEYKQCFQQITAKERPTESLIQTNN